MKYIYYLITFLTIIIQFACNGGENNPPVVDTKNDLIITSTLVMTNPYVGIGPQWGGYDEIKSLVETDELSQSDWEKLYARVGFMRPGLVRLMGSQGWNYLVNGQYNPLKSEKILFKILDFCELNDINVMYGEWGQGKLSGNMVDTLWLDRAVDFLDYLLNTKNYTCIKYLNMCNEPNGSWSSIGGDLDLWKRTYDALLRRVETKNLSSKITVIAPDVTVGSSNSTIEWINTARNTFGTKIGAYDVHAYPSDEKVKDGSFLSQIKSYRASAPSNMDFIIGELGYKYSLTSALGIENTRRIAADPYASDDSNMMVYDAFYGIDMANVVIQSMYAGCNGIIIWDMDDAMYLLDGKLKRWGFWNILGEEKFGAKDEEIRPWYYTMSLMCRYFPTGSKIYKAILPNKKGVEAIAAEKDGKYSILIINYHAVDYEINLKTEAALEIPDAMFYSYIASLSGSQFDGSVDTNGFPSAYKTQNLNLSNSKSLALDIKARSFTLITNIE